MDELFLRLRAVGDLGWASLLGPAPEARWGPRPGSQFMSDRGPLAGWHSGLLSGLGALKARSTEWMEHTKDMDAADRVHTQRTQRTQGTHDANDAESFDKLFEAERADIARVCHRLLDNPAAAEDASSEIFLRARRALSSYDAEQPFRPWLRAIASNYCIDQLRRQKLERKLFSQADLSEDGLADPSPDVLRCLTRTQERREVLSAIDSLPAKYRLPLVLRFYRDLDYEAIALLLGVTRNQVGSLLFRAKLQLRERLARGIDGVGSDIGLDAETPESEPAEASSAEEPKPRRRRRTGSSASTPTTKRSARP